MIVSQQYQVETDQNGNPVAFHKLRSIRMPNHAAPRIAHSNEQAYPSITNIHSHSNNPNNIQFMPAMAPGNRNIGAVEVLLLIVVIAIAFVLVIDLSGISKSNKGTNHNQQYRDRGSNQMYGFSEEESEWEQVIDDLQQTQQQRANVLYKQSVHDSGSLAQQNGRQKDGKTQSIDLSQTQRQFVNGEYIKSNNRQIITDNLIEIDDKSGQWILQSFIDRLNEQQLRQARIKNNNNGNMGNRIQINRLSNNLMYESTDKQWISFLKLGINHFKCFNDQNSRHDKYCQQLIEEWENHINIDGQIMNNQQL